jgi:hypothetical protein
MLKIRGLCSFQRKSLVHQSETSQRALIHFPMSLPDCRQYNQIDDLDGGGGSKLISKS